MSVERCFLDDHTLYRFFVVVGINGYDFFVCQWKVKTK